MKTRMLTMAVAMCFAVAGVAKDIKTVVLNTLPEMHCSNCENKIKSNIRFEKGVKEITTDLTTKTVTIKYDADKTTVDNIIKGFAKIDYVATVADGTAAKTEAAAGSCCGSDGCKCGSKKSEAAGGCCSSKKSEATGGCCSSKKTDAAGGCCSSKKSEAAGGCCSSKKSEAAGGCCSSKKTEAAGGCCGSDGCKCGSKKSEAAGGCCSSKKSEGDAVAYFKADQMKCGGCAAKVKKNLSADAGVKDVTVDLDSKVVKVSYDSAKTSVAQLVDDFKKFEYSVVEVNNEKE